MITGILLQKKKLNKNSNKKKMNQRIIFKNLDIVILQYIRSY